MTIMKKYILLLCALCVGLVSCVKEDFGGAEADGLVTFKASYEAPTKTVLNGLTPYWTPTDKISIFNGVNNEFTATVSEPSATATFKGELAGKGTKNFRAVTPYSADYTFSSLGSAFYGLSVPQEQTAVENTYDPQALVAIAQSDDYTLSFKNLGSLVKFTVISDGVTSVTLRSNNEEVLSGTFEATYAATPSIRVREGKDEVTIKGDFKKGSTYYIVTLPASLEKGFIALLNGSTKSMAVDAPVVLARSGMVNLGDLSLNPGESQLPGADEEEDEGVPSSWIIIGQFCNWAEDGALATYDMGSYYKAFDVPAASLSSFKFRNGDVWLGVAGETVAADKWVSLSQDGSASDISFSGSATTYDVYLDKDLRAFYVTAAGNPAPEPIPAPFIGKSVAGNFNAWSNSANPMTSEGDYYVVKGLQLASTNLADPTSNGFKFVDVKGTDNAIWYGVGTPSIEVSKWYSTKVDGSLNIIINGDATALYDAYIAKDMSTFCVVAAGAELPSKDEVGNDNVETDGTIYLKPNANWKEAGARFAAYFFEGDTNTWMSMTDADGDGVYECGVPSGYSNVIFTRMNPASSDNNWDNKWNQTADLKIPTDGTNCYTVKDGTWDNGGGTWSTYNAGGVDPTPDPTPDPDPTPGEGDGQDPGEGSTPGSDSDYTVCRLVVKAHESVNWYDKYIYAWINDQPIIGNWPGVKMGWEKFEGGYHYYYYDFDKAYDGKTIGFVIGNGNVNGGAGNQTKDKNVTLQGATTTVVIESSDMM